MYFNRMINSWDSIPIDIRGLTIEGGFKAETYKYFQNLLLTKFDVERSCNIWNVMHMQDLHVHGISKVIGQIVARISAQL